MSNRLLAGRRGETASCLDPRLPQPQQTGAAFKVPSLAAATVQGKTQGFVLRLPPQHKAPWNIHAASAMGLQLQVAKPCVSAYDN